MAGAVPPISVTVTADTPQRRQQLARDIHNRADLLADVIRNGLLRWASRKEYTTASVRELIASQMEALLEYAAGRGTALALPATTDEGELERAAQTLLGAVGCTYCKKQLDVIVREVLAEVRGAKP